MGRAAVPANSRATVRGRATISEESAGKIAQLSAGTAARPTNQTLSEIGFQKIDSLWLRESVIGEGSAFGNLITKSS